MYKSERATESEIANECVCMSVFSKGNFAKSTDTATQHNAFYYYYTHFIEKNKKKSIHILPLSKRMYICTIYTFAKKNGNKKTIQAYTKR